MAERLMYATGEVRNRKGQILTVVKHFLLEWSSDGMDIKLRGLQEASALCDACGQTMINETSWKVCLVYMNGNNIVSEGGHPKYIPA